MIDIYKKIWYNSQKYSDFRQNCLDLSEKGG